MRATLWVLTAAVCLAQDATPERLIEAGHWKRARALVERRLHQAPDDANAIFLTSQIRNAFGDHTSPTGLAERAVRLDPRVARFHRQLAECQGVMAQHAGLFQQVLLARRFRKEINAALAIDPRDTQALRDLLEYYLLAPGLVGGDEKKAEATAQQISAIDAAEGFLAQARIGEFRKDQTRTLAMLKRAAEVRPLSYKAQMALAQFYLAPAHRDEPAAEAVAKEALALDPGRIGAYSVLAAIDAGRGDWNGLEGVLAAAVREVPDDFTPYYRAAERMLADGGDPARAGRYLRRYLTQESEGNQPTAADARWKLGLALRAEGQEANAVREWKLALQLDPESPAARELKANRNASAGGTSNKGKTGGAN